MLKKLPILLFFVIALQLVAINDVYALDRGTGNGFKRDSLTSNYYDSKVHRKRYYSDTSYRNNSYRSRYEAPVLYTKATNQGYRSKNRSQNGYRSNQRYNAYLVANDRRAHFGGTQYSQKDNLRSRDDVIREVKRRHNCEILKVSLDERKQQYKVRVLMPNGKVRNLKISARR